MVEGEGRSALCAYFRERFGVPASVLDGFVIRERGETFWALSREEATEEPAASLKVVSLGLPLARRLSKYLKPTSPALRLLSPWITRNRIRLDEADALRLLAHREIVWSGELSEGYVLLETVAGPLGCGLALPGRLRAELPRSEVRTLGPLVGDPGSTSMVENSPESHSLFR